jgi:hypothetical protein
LNPLSFGLLSRHVKSIRLEETGRAVRFVGAASFGAASASTLQLAQMTAITTAGRMHFMGRLRGSNVHRMKKCTD